jgi:hypothetical protein
MARPRQDTKWKITVRGISYAFFGYAPDMNRAVIKAGKRLNKAQFLNTGYNNEVAIYIAEQ